MTDELMKRINEGQTVLISEIEDDGPFMAIVAPRIGADMTETRPQDDPVTRGTPRTEKPAS